MLSLHLIITLAFAAAESSADQAANTPSIELLLYLDEFSGIDEEVVDLAVLCAKQPDEQKDRDSTVQAWLQCDDFLETSAPLGKPLNKEEKPHE